MGNQGINKQVVAHVFYQLLKGVPGLEVEGVIYRVPAAALDAAITEGTTYWQSNPVCWSLLWDISTVLVDRLADEVKKVDDEDAQDT